MRIVKPGVDFYGAVPTGYKRALKVIEMAGRTCYRSEGKITKNSAEGFVMRLANAKHLAMLEHSNFVVKIKREHGASPAGMLAQAGNYLNITGSDDTAYVGGNLTAWAIRHRFITEVYSKNTSWDDSMFLPFIELYGKVFGTTAHIKRSLWEQCPFREIPHELHRFLAKFTCDRGVSHEIVRHRPCSFAQESTRYVNYGGKDMEFVEPAGYDDWAVESQNMFESACVVSEMAYNDLIDTGLKPQQARAALTNALRTELVVTADAKEWAHIRKLRTHKSAHPDIVRVMNMIPWERFL